ncbi:methyltransferase [Nocardiopsis alba]|uniref:methyltransferase n=1 Tax=Nocardiopsis TaxID=2013 RepID=UPI002DB8EBBB|nr:methyltransferase [Nocardiopsis sp. LDBS1602]MEC3894039.1 methyltransferase [Nocardiopsis sp. LDBS1602]
MQRLLLLGMPWVGQAIYVIAKLGVADALADGPVGSDELAAQVSAHPGALYRFCRAMTALELMEEHSDRRFSLTEGGHLLRTGAPGSFRHFAVVNGAEAFAAWAEVEHSVRTGEPAFERVHGMPHFDYLAQNPEANSDFNAMAGAGTTPRILADLDLSEARVIVDIGGSTGTTLSEVLRGNPQASGILQDLPNVVAEAPEVLRRYGVEDRCEIVGKSFFDGVPEGADVYLLCRVLHDWSDEDSLRLLDQVRSAMRPGARLVIVDQTIPDTPGFHPGKLTDLQMLVVLGGKERTVEEMTDLLDKSGFQVTGVRRPEVPGPGGETAIEAVAS